MPEPVLRVDGLHVSYGVRAGPFEALHDISFELAVGEVLGVVGESGCGKSTLSASLLRLLPPNGWIWRGSMSLHGQDLLSLSDHELRRVRGGQIAMIFQDPLTSLNPTFKISTQMVNAQRAHVNTDERPSRDLLRQRAIEMLDRVGIENPERRINDYPHQFSGGMRQRIMVGTALLLRPEVLICDEATSALDVTLQAQILQMLRELCAEQGTAVIVISHDIGVISEICDRVIVLHAGRMVEAGTVEAVLTHPQDAYTRDLIAAVPSRHRRGERLLTIPERGVAPTDNVEEEALQQKPARYRAEPATSEDSRPLVDIRGLRVHFADRRSIADAVAKRPTPTLHAVDGIDLTLGRGEIVGLVGESGSGKTTLGKALLNLEHITGGSISFDGALLAELGADGWRKMRRQMQMIFQEPYGSLSPRLRVERLITEPYRINRTPAQDRYSIDELLALVGLSGEQATKYPHELSGGQARRVGVARALAVQPRLLVADEPTAGLDVSAAGRILNLLQDLRTQLSLTLLIITHDLNVIGYVADRIAVMQKGRIVEAGTVDEIMDSPQHPYTQNLLASIPDIYDRYRPMGKQEPFT